MASMRRRRVWRTRSSIGGVGAITARCYDSATPDARAVRGRRRPSRSSEPIPLVRQILLAIAWLAAVLLIALGAAGLVTAIDGPAAAGSRPWLTARDDVVVDARLDAIATELTLVSDQLDALGVQGRAALSALVAND